MASDENAETQAGQPVTRDRRRDVRLVATGVVAVLLVWFALPNLQEVEIHFWVTSTRSPVIVVVAISVLLGSLVSILLSRFGRSRRRGGSED